jgi:hypothetical protein
MISTSAGAILVTPEKSELLSIKQHILDEIKRAAKGED